MKVLIVGADGQLGRALQRTAPESAMLVPCARAQLDISQTDSIEKAVAAKSDVIINAAAYTAVDRAESEPDVAHAVNALGAAHMAQAAATSGARLIHISTDFVFDGTQGRPYRPDDAPNPLNVYGASKLAGERAVQRACSAALVLRTAWVYSWEGRNFLRTMLRLMTERDALQVVDDQIGSPTSADSLAAAVWKAVDSDLTGLYHWTDAGVASWFDFAVAIRNGALQRGLLNRSVPVAPIGSADFPTPARRPSMSVLDKRTSYAALGTPLHWTASLGEQLDCLNRHSRV